MIISVCDYNSWNKKNTKDDFMTYLYFFIDQVFAVTRSPLLNVNKISKRLSVDSTFIPDVKISYDYKTSQALNLLTVEVKKKAQASYTPNNLDFINIHLQLKAILDKLIRLNIDHPVVYGILMQGFDCHVIKMTLDGDGVYFAPAVIFFHLPSHISDVMFASKGTSIFITLKNELDQVVSKIQNKKKGTSPLVPWACPSYFMPALTKNP